MVGDLAMFHARKLFLVSTWMDPIFPILTRTWTAYLFTVLSIYQMKLNGPSKSTLPIKSNLLINHPERGKKNIFPFMNLINDKK